MMCEKDFFKGFFFNSDVEIEAAQYFSPLLYSDNVYYKGFISEFYSFSNFYNFLFNLKPFILKKIEDFKKENFKGYFIIGIHIRKNINENLFKDTPVNKYW
jgi:hypothetical protein